MTSLGRYSFFLHTIEILGRQRKTTIIMMSSCNKTIANIPCTTISTIYAMVRQEKYYLVKPTGTANLYQQEEQSPSTNGPLNAPPTPAIPAVNADYRSKMIEWCNSVVDFLNLDRETVSIAASYMDRYLDTAAGTATRTNPRVFQLAFMTSFYTATKIHEPAAIPPKLISQLSRGVYTEEEVEAMEIKLLTALQWRMNPPTALSFVQQFFDWVDSRNILDSETREVVYKRCKCQTEFAVGDSGLVSVKASTIAFCSFMNSVTLLDEATISNEDFRSIEATFSEALQLFSLTTIDLMVGIQDKLYQAIVEQEPILSMDTHFISNNDEVVENCDTKNIGGSRWSGGGIVQRFSNSRSISPRSTAAITA